MRLHWALHAHAVLFYRGVMMRSLKRCLMLTKLVKHLGHEIKYHGITKDEASHYCVHCDVSLLA